MRALRRLRGASLGLVAAIGILGSPTPTSSHETKRVEIRVLTYNLYLGASISRVLEAGSIHGLAKQVERIVQQVDETDFVARASALATVIAAKKPDVLSLQEVALWRRDPRGESFLTCADAEEVVWDFLPILLNALFKRGLDYRVAGLVVNEDVEAPTLTRGDGRLTDRNVILVAKGVEVLDTDDGSFDDQRTRSFYGIELGFNRGWISATLRKKGHRFRVVNTHLELTREIREAQIEELFGELEGETAPLILAGDFNTNAADSKLLSRKLKTFGLSDVWQAKGSGSGSTCCQPKSLTNGVSKLRWRPDLVLAGREFMPLSAKRLGADRASRARSGKQRLWISDHAGVLAVLELGP